MKVRLRLLTSLVILSLVASSWLTAGFSLASLQAGSLPAETVGQTPFPDVFGHWAEAAITEMYVKDIMKGYEDSTFKPNKPVTFLEAVVSISKMLKNDPTTADLESNKYLEDIFKIPGWASGHIGLALRQGLLNYSEIQKISLQLPLVRQDAAILAVRSLGLVEEAKLTKDTVLSFVDAPYVSKEAAPYVKVICDHKVMKGFPDGTFQPVRPITRAELSILLRNLAEQIPSVNADETAGLIQSVNKRLNLITLMDFKGRVIDFYLPVNGNIFFNDKPADITDLAEGTYIRLIVSKTDGYTLLLAKSVITGSPVTTEPVKLISAPTEIQRWVETNKFSEAYKAVGLANSMYLLAARGEKMTSGYTVNIVKVTSTTDDRGINYKVLMDLSDPAKGTIVMPAIEYPFALVKLSLPQINVYSVTFYNKQNQVIAEEKAPTIIR